MCLICDEVDQLVQVLRESSDRPLPPEIRERLIELLKQRKDEAAEASGEGW